MPRLTLFGVTHNVKGRVRIGKHGPDMITVGVFGADIGGTYLVALECTRVWFPYILEEEATVYNIMLTGNEVRRR